LTLKKGDVAAAARPLKYTGKSYVPLLGTWRGTLDGVGLFMRFGVDGRAELAGVFDTAAQRTVPMVEVSFDGVKLVAKAGAGGGEFRGNLSGDALKGEWVQGTRRVPMTFMRL
jgi:hypothetical protein